MNEYQKNQPNVGKYAMTMDPMLFFGSDPGKPTQKVDTHYMFLLGGDQWRPRKMWTSCMSFLLGGFPGCPDGSIGTFGEDIDDGFYSVLL